MDWTPRRRLSDCSANQAGGMGEVYRAVRADDQYRQEVALKVVRTGQDSGQVIQRFRNERQILASLDTPTSPACSTEGPPRKASLTW